MSDDDAPSNEGSDTFDAFLRDVARSEAREPPAKALVAGSIFGHYRIVDELGRGGMGIVYRAEDSRLARHVALKVLPPSFAGDDERRRRFLREARSAAAIDHPNIATVYEVGESDGRLFLAMERVAGSTLRARLAGSTLGQHEALRVVRQIAVGLARAHEKGIVHRDLKPENVMLTRDGGVKILDFGLAKLREPISDDDARSSTLTKEGQVMGTPGYMSPEQATGKPVDQRTDIYALGVVLHEMLTGELPGALGTGKVAADPRVAAIVTRCLAREAEQRFRSAGEVEVAIDALVKDGGTSKARRRGIAIGIAAVVVAAGAARALVGGAWRHRAEPAAVAASAGVPTTSRAIGLLDVPPPLTKSPEALVEYRRAMTDLRDATRRPAVSLRRALALDSEFAAAYLRLALDRWQPASGHFYGEAVRYRASLDARDLSILRAEEPIQASSPPDLAETERRYAALHEERPLDVEVLLALAGVRALRDPSAAQASYDDLLALDPTSAAGEYGGGWAAQRRGDFDAARDHYTRCTKMAPTAGRCFQALADLSAADDECGAYFEQLGRVIHLDPDDSYVREDMLNATLGSGRSPDDARAALQAAVDTLPRPPLDLAYATAQDEGEVDLWFGAFPTARTAFEGMDARFARIGLGGPLVEQELGIAEEIGDEARAVSILRDFVGARGTTTTANPEYDDVVLQGLRTHHAVPPAELTRLRESWLANAKAGGLAPWKAWLFYDAAPAATEAEARDALARGDDSAVPRRAGAHVNAVLGSVLLVAGRYADAASRLERAAFDCRPIVSDSDSDTVLIVRAALDLGRAREALGDTGGACVAYQRVLGRWGRATPRSITADAARAAVKRLHCVD